MINFDEVTNTAINKAVASVENAEFGILETDEDICKLNTLNILARMKDVEDKVDEENLINLKNNLL